MPYFQLSIVEEDGIEVEEKESQLKTIQEILEEEVSLLEEKSIRYEIIPKGKLCYNSQEDYICLPVKEIYNYSIKYKLILESNEEKRKILDNYELYIRNLVQMIICHEAGHALSKSTQKITERSIELINGLMDSLIELDHEGIYYAEKELHNTKYQEEENAWRIGRDLMKGSLEFYDFIRDYELGFYRKFIDDRMVKLVERMKKYASG